MFCICFLFLVFYNHFDIVYQGDIHQGKLWLDTRKQCFNIKSLQPLSGEVEWKVGPGGGLSLINFGGKFLNLLGPHQLLG